MLTKPRILLVDDNKNFGREVRRLLEPDFDVVGAVQDGTTAIEATERLTPDVIVLDVRMPGMGGIEVARSLSERFPAAKVVFLSSYLSRALIREVLSTGALGYVLKASVVEDLGGAILAALEGRTFVSCSGKPVAMPVQNANTPDGK